ncbi:alkaline phosphatase [Saccharicrinis carchari]|uniref:Alkaline phosphatase n=1 Tax=Saccharicrinis carchari TaxID=1168039 RepID=A0A521D4Z0_SACCC|nr:metallophosphoesterase [Saccharicrinis carchari]SMO66773.1 alkaline phosphatase [Saccharicrinis carchari]
MGVKINRRGFIKNGALIIAGVSFLPMWARTSRKLTFGWVTDIHYAQAPVKWGRYFTESVNKLKEAIDLFNEEKVDFVIETGDFKDQTEPPVESETLSYLKTVEAEFIKFNGPRYHVLGNHDLDSLSKKQFTSNVDNTGIKSGATYYYFDQSGFRFIVLDACFKSDGSDYDHDNFHWTDTNIPPEQLAWLKKVLAQSDKPTIIFVHQLLDGEGDLYVNNAAYVRKVLEDSGTVAAVFQGHKHDGGARVINGILYYTLRALVEGSGKTNNSYAIVNLDTNGEVVIEGYRKAKDYDYKFQQRQLACL